MVYESVRVDKRERGRERETENTRGNKDETGSGSCFNGKRVSGGRTWQVRTFVVPLRLYHTRVGLC